MEETLTLELNKIYLGEALETLKTFPANSIDCVITSPPYWGLRDYGTGEWIGGDKNCNHYRDNKSKSANTGQKREGANSGDGIYKNTCFKCGALRIDRQLGLEKTPGEYIIKIVEIFNEVRRVLKKEGTLWLNLGDSYAGGGRGCNTPKQQSNRGTRNMPDSIIPKGLKQKDLVGIPWRVAFALQSDGWYLRQDIIWHKSNPMPESVTDRCTKAHEYIFLLAKSKKYYFEIQREKLSEAYLKEKRPFGILRQRLYPQSKYQKEEYGSDQFKTKGETRDYTGRYGNDGKGMAMPYKWNNPLGRNKRSVWTIATHPFKEAHFATFPENLIEPMIKAGCPQGGVCLDPFMGSGTTALVARNLSRKFVGIELNPKYIEIAEKRLQDAFGMFR